MRKKKSTITNIIYVYATTSWSMRCFVYFSYFAIIGSANIELDTFSLVLVTSDFLWKSIDSFWTFLNDRPAHVRKKIVRYLPVLQFEQHILPHRLPAMNARLGWLFAVRWRRTEFIGLIIRCGAIVRIRGAWRTKITTFIQSIHYRTKYSAANKLGVHGAKEADQQKKEPHTQTPAKPFLSILRLLLTSAHSLFFFISLIRSDSQTQSHKSIHSGLTRCWRCVQTRASLFIQAD